MEQDKKYISLTKLKRFFDNSKNTFAEKQHTHKTDELLESENHLFVTKQEKDYLESKVGTIQTLPSPSGSFTYNGSTHRPVWNNFNENELTISGQTSGVNAGNYVVTFTPVAGRVWFDGTSSSKNVTWTINRATISKVPTQTDIPTYNNNQQSPIWVGYEPSKMTIGGSIFGTDAGSYIATFIPTSNYKWSDGTYTAKQVTWVINRKPVEVPYQQGSLTYNGTIQRPTWSDYNESYFTINGNTEGLNAGVYVAMFTPKSNYCFADGSAFKNVDWSIDKANSAITPSFPSTITFAQIGEKIKLYFSVIGTGRVSVTFGNDSIVQVPNGLIKQGNNYYFIAVAVGNGNTSFNITVSSDINYNSTSLLVPVTVNAVAADPILNNNSPQVIKEMAQSGQAQNLWSVGDTIDINLNGTVGSCRIVGSCSAFIIGFNHNSSIEGNNTIHFQFGKMTTSGLSTDIAFVDSYYSGLVSPKSTKAFRMISENDTTGGWNKCEMRNYRCSEFYNILPFEWQNVITPCTKYTDNVGNYRQNLGGVQSAVTSTQDKIFLLSEYELTGQTNYSNSFEAQFQKQYMFYANGNSRIKYKHLDTTDKCSYWVRSLSTYRYNKWCYADIEGYVYEDDAKVSYGFCPCFMVA